MRTLFNGVLLFILISSCSKIEPNDDPVIGIWEHNVKAATNINKMVVDKEEWIFNDVYLGRFHGYNNGEITYLTDFKWTVEGNIYTISYPGTDFPDDQAILIENEEGTHLQRLTGDTLAIKQN
ncbi:lipocalin family protein [Maribacter thermophilus]|uniref:lipocalin family protein n=1 Tax=Maribacter thermophilus TaxID=1197874 RepID=UPI0006417A72|nr:lipocalin family protein [Maribacter thermophilus]